MRRIYLFRSGERTNVSQSPGPNIAIKLSCGNEVFTSATSLAGAADTRPTSRRPLRARFSLTAHHLSDSDWTKAHSFGYGPLLLWLYEFFVPTAPSRRGTPDRPRSEESRTEHE